MKREKFNLNLDQNHPSRVSFPTHPAQENKLEFDEENTAEKEAGNQPKLSASSPASGSVSSVKELFEVSGLCQAYKRVSREDRNQREKGELGLSYTNPLARQLSVRLDKLDLISRDIKNQESSVNIQTSTINTQ